MSQGVGVRVTVRPRGGIAVLAVGLLAVLLPAAAHHVRPTPYGDHLTVAGPGAVAAPAVRVRGAAVEAYGPSDGDVRWRYAREGRWPVAVVGARGVAMAAWDDGVVTGTGGRGDRVRWHRALPGVGRWLRAHGGRGVLRPMGPGILAVVTPDRVTAYRTSDGDLRWMLPARGGCAFRPERAVRHAGALLVAQPCAQGAWTAQVIALDAFGRIAPHRRPLANDRPGDRLERPHAEKALASPR